jgi:predicted TIM-barrel fold metal-dependent hydrolase
VILDCDLLIGRDGTEGRTIDPDALHTRLETSGIHGGAVGSLRAIQFDPGTGNAETLRAAEVHGWFPVLGVHMRNPLEAEAVIDEAAALGVPFVRLALSRNGIAPTAPRTRIVAGRAADKGVTLLVEGSTSTYGTALMGLGAAVVFLDQHFYDLGEFIQVAREEPGFHTSTRLLGSPDAWEGATEHLGAERLVFGTRAGWFEEHAVLERLRTSRLTPQQRDLVTEGNLRRLAKGTPR